MSQTGLAAKTVALLRIAFGVTFLWAFVDKLFALGFHCRRRASWTVSTCTNLPSSAWPGRGIRVELVPRHGLPATVVLDVSASLS